MIINIKAEYWLTRESEVLFGSAVNVQKTVEQELTKGIMRSLAENRAIELCKTANPEKMITEYTAKLRVEVEPYDVSFKEGMRRLFEKEFTREEDEDEVGLDDQSLRTFEMELKIRMMQEAFGEEWAEVLASWRTSKKE